MHRAGRIEHARLYEEWEQAIRVADAIFRDSPGYQALPEALKLAHARDLAQRCLQAVHRENIPHGSSPTADHVTISIGVVGTASGPVTLEAAALLKAADQALYEAKRGGRNRVVGQALGSQPKPPAA